MVDPHCNIPSNHRPAERVLIKYVESGEWTIDELGRIWTHKPYKNLPVPRRKERWLPSDYLTIHRWVDGRSRVGFAHRLVWQYFYGDIPAGLTINHKNGVKCWNVPSNLELATYSENMKHAYYMGLLDEHGERNPAAKLSDEAVVSIRSAYIPGQITMFDLAEQYGVRFQQISRIIRGDRRILQGGATSKKDHRYTASARDPITGRFVPRNGEE